MQLWDNCIKFLCDIKPSVTNIQRLGKNIFFSSSEFWAIDSWFVTELDNKGVGMN